MGTMTYTGELVVEQCWCGIVHAVPMSLVRRQEEQLDAGEQHTSIYCPLGHAWVRKRDATPVAKLKQELSNKDWYLQRERQQHDQTRAELRETESRRRAEKAAKTRLKNRVANGVCPCCNRHFKDLYRHIAGQHPEYAAKE